MATLSYRGFNDPLACLYKKEKYQITRIKTEPRFIWFDWIKRRYRNFLL